ncbi:hypothetical protein TNCV_910391 [Trichonephila clavipes]|uniref:Uncharacterized protein n=1 Tax=Trichonephila clavipes TaxID=2585209 RepID=A0A8X7BDM4_TRICX|nr:hypothetical protein TNCV_910391 [Trichonephila clavipes]
MEICLHKEQALEVTLLEQEQEGFTKWIEELLARLARWPQQEQAGSKTCLQLDQAEGTIRLQQINEFTAGSAKGMHVDLPSSA